MAFSHSLNRVSATTTDGEKLDMWWRATVCYRKIDGKWMVTHEHASVPFDVEERPGVAGPQAIERRTRAAGSGG